MGLRIDNSLTFFMIAQLLRWGSDIFHSCKFQTPKSKALFLTVLLIVTFTPSYAINYYIDGTVDDEHFFKEKLLDCPNDGVFHLISHGKPGSLFINGHWLNAEELGYWLCDFDFSLYSQIHIYGCSFGEGKIGHDAVDYLESVLCKEIAASTNMTGRSGDWILEIGNKDHSEIGEKYRSNLQVPCDHDVSTNGRPVLHDIDGDGVRNTCDIDNDNDGIVDTTEEEHCFTDQVTYSFDGVVKGAKDRGAPDDLTRDFIYGDNYSIILSFHLNSSDMNQPVIFEVFAGDNDNASSGSITIDGETKTVNATAGQFDKLTFSPATEQEYIIEVNGTDVPINAIHIKTLNQSEIILLDFGDENSPESDDGFGIFFPTVSTPPYPTGAYFFHCGWADTDMDNWPDFVDIDSDGDHCPDALEGGNNVHYDEINHSTFRLKGSVDPSGLIGLPQTIGHSKEPRSQSSQCSNCVSDSGQFVDTDGDGLGDDCDLDKDNDGILDVAEFAFFKQPVIPLDRLRGIVEVGDQLVTVEFSTDTGIIENATDTHFSFGQSWDNTPVGSKYMFTFYTPVHELHLNIKDLSFNHDNDKAVIGNFVLTLWDNTVLENVEFKLSTEDENEFQPVIQDYEYNGTTYHAITGSLVGMAKQASGTIEFLNLPDLHENGIQSVEYTILHTSPYFNLTSSVKPIISSSFDDDTDTVPNFKDIDSDNDGCIDALEGDADIEIGETVVAGGTISIGPGSGADSRNLCADPSCIDAMGVPLVVSGVGQGLGTSTDPNAKDEACDYVLPVDFANFSVNNVNGVGEVYFLISESENVSKFEVQKSTDGSNFETIGVLFPYQSIRTNTGDSYELKDNQLRNGWQYYRIKVVDYDGTHSFSDIRSLLIENSSLVNIYPTVASNELKISGEYDDDLMVNIVNTFGLPVYSKELSGTSIDVTGLTPGYYFIIFTNSEGNEIQKFKFMKTN